MNKECENCIKRKTMWCPTSIDCMALDELPYYLDKISALEKIDDLEQENQQLKEQLANDIDRYEDTISYQLGFDKGKEKYYQALLDIKEYIEEHIKYECDNAFNGMQFYSHHLYGFSKKDLLDIVNKALGDKENDK